MKANKPATHLHHRSIKLVVAPFYPPILRYVSLLFSRRGRSASLRQGRASTRLGCGTIVAISQNFACCVCNTLRSLFSVHCLTSLLYFSSLPSRVLS